MNYLHNVFIVRRNFSFSEFFLYHCIIKSCATLTNMKHVQISQNSEHYWKISDFHHHNIYESITKVYQTTFSHGTTNSTHIIIILFYLFCNVIQTSSVGWVTRPKVGVTTWPSTILTLNFLRIETSVIVAST